MKPWSREDISACDCSARTYRHVHCPCFRCQGSATDKTTELRHWRENCLLATVVGSDSTSGSLADIDSDHESIASPSSPASPSTPGTAEVDDSLSERSDENSDNPICPELDIGEPTEGPGTEPCNPLKKVILTAVLDALKIMDESGSSVKTLDDILSYGKTMLYTLIDGNVDLDVLNTMWPKNWNDVQLLLKEEGFEDAKELFICFCRTEKVITRNGKTHTKFVYSGNFSIMDNKDACCTHCGDKGLILLFGIGK